MSASSIRRILIAAAAAAGATAAALPAPALGAGTAAAAAPQLTRYPYLTDVVSAGPTGNAAVNFATDQTVTAARPSASPEDHATPPARPDPRRRSPSTASRSTSGR